MQHHGLKMDLTALSMVRQVLVKYAIELLDKKGVLRLLEKPQDLDTIAKVCRLNNKKMLENMLDILVGEDIVAYGEKYYSLKQMKEIDIGEAEGFLIKYYKESLEWINFVNKYSEYTLVSGNPSKLTGFEEEKAIYYWNKIMEQSPYSLRVMAITELYKNLKPDALILDYGCGSGVGLEQLIELSDKPIYFVGTDPSKKFFIEAKNRIKNLRFDDQLRNKNADNVKFEDFSNLDSYFGKFDGIFISIIFNHIDQEEYVKVLSKLNNLLKSNGKLVIVQLIDFDKFNRNPIWVMHNIPSHKGYPMKEKFLSDIKSVFSEVEEILDGMITVSTKK